MGMNIIETFIKRPVFTFMFIMVLIVFGIRSYPQLGLDMTPDVDLPYVGVTVTYEGTAPEEMETLITKKIENRVSQVSGIKTITSTIREGYSATTIEFEMGLDPLLMANEVREKVASVRRSLPDDIDEPVVQRFDSASRPIAGYSFRSDVRSPGEIRRFINDVVKDELQRLDGVAEVSIFGSADRAIKVHVNPEKLSAYGISIQTVLEKVNAANENTPGGKIRDGRNTITVRTIGKFKTVDDVQKVVVANSNGRPVMLTDIADIEDSWEDAETYNRTNGVPGVYVAIRKQSKTNTVQVTDAVNAALAEMRKHDIPEDIVFDIVNDQSRYIRENVNDVWNTIFFGGTLALAITYLFLRDIRATLIGGMAIPTSVIATFYIMKLCGFTLNNMSLMALSLAVGFLIDDAIVLIENVFRHMEMGEQPVLASARATEELVLAILATSMSLLAVFVPIGNMGETVGQFFKEFGMTVAFALIFSTISAYSLTPMLSAHFLVDYTDGKPHTRRPEWLTKFLDWFESGFQAIRSEYDKAMKVAIRHPWKIVLISVATLVFNVALVPFLGVELSPVYDSGEFNVMVKGAAGTSLEEMIEITQPIEQEIARRPEVRVAATRIGGTRTPINESTISVKLKPRDERSKGMLDLMDELRKEFRNVGDARVIVTHNQGVGGNESRPVQIGLRGNDLGLLKQYANTLAEGMRATPGATDVEVTGIDEEPEILIQLNPLRASELGLDADTVGDVVGYSFLGKSARNNFTVGNNDYDIIVQMESKNRRTLDDVRNLRVSTKTGQFVRLGDVATVELGSGPTLIERQDRQRQVKVVANTSGTSPGDLLMKVQNELIPDMNMELGYRYKLVGQSDMMSRTAKEVIGAVVLAIILIYMVLAAEFESFTQPFVIMMSLPFAVIGAILGLLVSGQTANMMSMIGFTMLLGLATKNAILLVDYANQAREKGQDMETAILDACSLRIRPIFMTTLSTLLGMLPIALGIGEGAELRQSMGVVLVGGITTSTLLTLVVVPLIYLLTERYKAAHHQATDISVLDEKR